MWRTWLRIPWRRTLASKTRGVGEWARCRGQGLRGGERGQPAAGHYWRADGSQTLCRLRARVCGCRLQCTWSLAPCLTFSPPSVLVCKCRLKDQLADLNKLRDFQDSAQGAWYTYIRDRWIDTWGEGVWWRPNGERNQCSIEATKWRDHICTHIQASIHVRHGEAVEGFFQSMLWEV